MWTQNLFLQRLKSQAQRVDMVKIWNNILEPGEVVEGFDDTDETNSDLEDEPVPLSTDEVLVLSCI